MSNKLHKYAASANKMISSLRKQLEEANAELEATKLELAMPFNCGSEEPLHGIAAGVVCQLLQAETEIKRLQELIAAEADSVKVRVGIYVSEAGDLRLIVTSPATKMTEEELAHCIADRLGGLIGSVVKQIAVAQEGD